MMAKSQQNTATNQTSTTPIPAKSPVILSLEALQSVSEEVSDYLSGTEYEHIKLTISSGLERLISRLSFLTGNDISTSAPVKFEPVTNFMGENIERNTKDVTEDDLDPTEAEKRAYLAKVDKLYAEIDTLDVNAVLNSYSDAEGEQVLRGVAKRADVGGYDVRDLKIPFVEEIIAGKKAKEAAAKEEEEIQKQLAELDKK